MPERPDRIFGTCLLLAGAAAVALLGAVFEAGPRGVAGFATVSAGLVSACILFAVELRNLPPAVVVVSSTALASSVALLHALCSIWREQRSIRTVPRVVLAESDYRDSLPDPGDVDVQVVRSRRQGAFCAGLLRPQVVITTALLDALDPDERRAVLEHELSHARHKAPLKLALGRLAARTLFWVPLLRDLAERYVLLTELEADRASIAATSPAALAGALSQALETPAITGSVGIADHAAARIDRVFDAREASAAGHSRTSRHHAARARHARGNRPLPSAPEHQGERAAAHHVGQLARAPPTSPPPGTRHDRARTRIPPQRSAPNRRPA